MQSPEKIQSLGPTPNCHLKANTVYANGQNECVALSTPVSQAWVGQYCSPDKLCLTIQTWQMSAHVCHLCNIVISLGISIHTRIKPWIPYKLSSFIWHVSLNGLYCAIRLWECFLHFFFADPCHAFCPSLCRTTHITCIYYHRRTNFTRLSEAKSLTPLDYIAFWEGVLLWLNG